MYPPLYLTPIEYEYDGKLILYIRVPVSPSVCRCSGRIYDRNHEADIDITDNQEAVCRLYSRKQNSYFVNRVYPVFTAADLRQAIWNLRPLHHSPRIRLFQRSSVKSDWQTNLAPVCETLISTHNSIPVENRNLWKVMCSVLLFHCAKRTQPLL